MQQRYRPFGEEYYSSGVLPTDYTFTGQRRESQSCIGNLMDYGARFYSPGIGRFISADTIVPGASNPQSLNRYSYALGNPLKYTDPTGHAVCNTHEDCEDANSTPSGKRTYDEYIQQQIDQTASYLAQYGVTTSKDSQPQPNLSNQLNLNKKLPPIIITIPGPFINIPFDFESLFKNPQKDQEKEKKRASRPAVKVQLQFHSLEVNSALVFPEEDGGAVSGSQVGNALKNIYPSLYGQGKLCPRDCQKKGELAWHKAHYFVTVTAPEAGGMPPGNKPFGFGGEYGRDFRWDVEVFYGLQMQEP